MKNTLDAVLGAEKQPNKIKPSSSAAFVVNDDDHLHNLSFVSYVQENYPFSLNIFKFSVVPFTTFLGIFAPPNFAN